MRVGIDFVYAPRRIVDADLERVVYGPGDVVPMRDAIKYGLVPAPDPEPEPSSKPGRRKGPRKKRAPAEDRAHRAPAEDREAV